ncbi:MAG: ferritin-like domain-containing protein [Ilumatobacteraceae bacterium]
MHHDDTSELDTPEVGTSTIGRRALIRHSALTVTIGALAAACGSGRTGSDAPGRLGVADEATPLLDEPVDDLTLLRTAQSLEHTAIDVYAAAGSTGVLAAGEAALVQRFVDDHRRHSDSVGGLISARGGELFECANPFLVDRAVTPILAALDGSDDLKRDLFNIAYAFESLAGASYQALVPALTEPALRRSAMEIGGEEQRHAAALAAALNPTTYFNPMLTGGQPGTDAVGIPLRYAVPSVFGTVGGIDLVVGAVNDEGSRFSIQLQTPAANSLVYSDASC